MAARTLPGLGLKAFFTLGEDGWNDEFDVNMLLASALIQCTVKDFVAATPGAPTDGDIYLFTDTHPTQANKIAVRDNGAWYYIVPAEGWLVWDATANSYRSFFGGMWAVLSTGGGGGALYYKVASFFVGTPVASETLMLHPVDEDFTFPANFVDSQVVLSGANPTATFLLTIKRGATTIGTISVATTGVVTLATTGGVDQAVTTGAVISISAPVTPDATVTGLSWNLRGIL